MVIEGMARCKFATSGGRRGVNKSSGAIYPPPRVEMENALNETIDLPGSSRRFESMVSPLPPLLLVH